MNMAVTTTAPTTVEVETPSVPQLEFLTIIRHLPPMRPVFHALIRCPKDMSPAQLEEWGQQQIEEARTAMIEKFREFENSFFYGAFTNVADHGRI